MILHRRIGVKKRCCYACHKKFPVRTLTFVTVNDRDIANMDVEGRLHGKNYIYCKSCAEKILPIVGNSAKCS